jgi:hypothetical protein
LSAAAALAEPEDRLLAEPVVGALAPGEVAEDLRAAVGVLLRQREQRLLPELAVRARC